MVKKAFAYRRVSTLTQVNDGFGLSVQEECVEKYAVENDIEIVGWFSDDGISGTIVDRDGLQSMLVALDENKDVKYVLCYNVSRMWRSDIAGGLIRYELSKRKVDIVSIQEPTYSLYADNASDYLINQIMQALASYDRMQINQKLAKGRRAKAKSGTKGCGSAPIGYKWNKDAEIEIDIDKSMIVTDIFTSYVRLKSLSRVAVHCTEKGYLTLQGNNFSKQSIKNILTNDYYIGIVRFAGKRYKGGHPVFISTRLFNEVQIIMGREPIEL
jgi:DNA invertase Pin-like site-specific DNA recombinase